MHGNRGPNPIGLSLKTQAPHDWWEERRASERGKAERRRRQSCDEGLFVDGGQAQWMRGPPFCLLDPLPPFPSPLVSGTCLTLPSPPVPSLQTGSVVLRSPHSSGSEGLEMAVAKLVVTCAGAAADTHASMMAQGALGPEETRVLADAALETCALADLQLQHRDLQSQMMLVGAALSLARAIGSFMEASAKMLEPCESTLRQAVAALEGGGGGPGALQAAMQAITRIHAVVQSVSDGGRGFEQSAVFIRAKGASSVAGGGGAEGEQQEPERVVGYAVSLLASCWPMVDALLARDREGRAEVAACAGKAAAAAMRADGKSFLGALEGLLRTSMTGLQQALHRQEGTEAAAALAVRLQNKSNAASPPYGFTSLCLFIYLPVCLSLCLSLSLSVPFPLSPFKSVLFPPSPRPLVFRPSFLQFKGFLRTTDALVCPPPSPPPIVPPRAAMLLIHSHPMDALLQRALAAATEVYGGWNWGGGWAAMAEGSGSDPEVAQRMVLSALHELNRAPVVQRIEERGGADKVRSRAPWGGLCCHVPPPPSSFQELEAPWPFTCSLAGRWREAGERIPFNYRP